VNSRTISNAGRHPTERQESSRRPHGGDSGRRADHRRGRAGGSVAQHRVEGPQRHRLPPARHPRPGAGGGGAAGLRTRRAGTVAVGTAQLHRRAAQHGLGRPVLAAGRARRRERARRRAALGPAGHRPSRPRPRAAPRAQPDRTARGRHHRDRPHHRPTTTHPGADARGLRLLPVTGPAGRVGRARRHRRDDRRRDAPALPRPHSGGVRRRQGRPGRLPAAPPGARRRPGCARGDRGRGAVVRRVVRALGQARHRRGARRPPAGRATPDRRDRLRLRPARPRRLRPATRPGRARPRGRGGDRLRRLGRHGARQPSPPDHRGPAARPARPARRRAAARRDRRPPRARHRALAPATRRPGVDDRGCLPPTPDRPRPGDATAYAPSSRGGSSSVSPAASTPATSPTRVWGHGLPRARQRSPRR
jgi:hypothetical protein